MIAKSKQGLAFLDLLLSLVMLGFLALSVYAEGKMLSALNAGRDNFNKKLEQYDWSVEELQENCQIKKYSSYKKASCCKEKRCAEFILLR